MGWAAHLRLPLAIALIAAIGACPAVAAPALFRVSDADSSIWLFGSVHLLERGREWRTAQLDDLLTTAEHVYFEIPISAETFATTTRLTMSKGYLTDGRTLDDLLSAESLTRLKSMLAGYGLPYRTVHKMQPWLVEMTLSQFALTSGEADTPDLVAGVEMTLSAEVEAARERGLETVEYQLSLFIDRPEAEQVASLESTIAALGESSFSLSGLLDAWYAGNLEPLQAEMEAGLGAPGTPYYDRFISQRNRNWAEEADRLLRDNDESLLVVGAGHLAGPVGLPTLLEQRGYTIERIDGQD